MVWQEWQQLVGIAMFIFSSRKIKKDENLGQTGVEPTHLQAYETSNSAGGYKTNRGEAILANHQDSKISV
jgi:hypothetical protein